MLLHSGLKIRIFHLDLCKAFSNHNLFRWAKLPLVGKWQKYFARVQNSCIYFCSSVESNDFPACYVIYNCSLEMMRLPVPEWDTLLHRTIVVKHDYDTEWLLLVLEEHERHT